MKLGTSMTGLFAEAPGLGSEGWRSLAAALVLKED